MMWSRAVGFLLVFVLSAGALYAQQVRGTVSEVGAGELLAGALLVVVDADSLVRATTISDSAGVFALIAPAGDSIRVRVQRLGYAALESVPMILQPNDSLRLEIRMRPSPVALEGVTATGEARLRSELERFLRRREVGFGRVFGPAELAIFAPTSTAVLLSSLPGGFLVPGAAGTILARRAGLEICVPDVYLDGFLVEPSRISALGNQPIGVPISSYVSPEGIVGVEVYRVPAQAPPEFQRAFMGDCPVVLIWTNHGFGIGETAR